MLDYGSLAGPRLGGRKDQGRLRSQGRPSSGGILLIYAAVALNGLMGGFVGSRVSVRAEDISDRHYRPGGDDACSHPGHSAPPIYVVPPFQVPRTFSYSTVVPGPVPYALYYRQQTVWLWRWDPGSGSGGYGGVRGIPYTYYQWQTVPLVTNFPLPGLPIGPVPQGHRPSPRDAELRRIEPLAKNAGRNDPAADNRNLGDDRMLQTGWRFLENGDRLFTQGKYREAYGQYRNAAKAVPRLADAYFRQVFALVAMGAYEQAAQAAKSGLEMHPEWPKGPFRLDKLYGNDQPAKRAHIARLAEAVQQSPQNGDLLFLLGVMLHFDNRMEEAKTFFGQALPLMAGRDQHVRLFLEN
ncbi:hypothetical protein [Thermopirellula anaerolimosa]